MHIFIHRQTIKLQRKLFFLIIAILIVFANVPSTIYGWGGENHRIITRNIVSLLPQGERDLLGAYADSLIQQYCVIPDLYRTPEFKDVYAPYIEIPYLPNTALYHHSEEEMVDFYVLTYILEKSVEQFKLKNIQEAARFLGTLTHFVEDNACPVHVVDNQMLQMLLPAPPSFVNFRIHGAVEGPLMTLRVPSYTPTKIGQTVFEMVNRILPRFKNMQDNSRAQAVSIVEGIYENNPEKSDIGKINAATPAVKLLVDIWETVLSIAYGK